MPNNILCMDVRPLFQQQRCYDFMAIPNRKMQAVCSPCFCTSVSAPCCSSTCVTASFPFRAAQYSTLYPRPFFASVLSPCSSNASATPSLRLATAICKAVVPSFVFASISTPCSISNRVTISPPLVAKICSTVSAIINFCLDISTVLHE